MTSRRAMLRCLPAAIVVAPAAAVAFRREVVDVSPDEACGANCEAASLPPGPPDEITTTDIERVMRLPALQIRCRFCGFAMSDPPEHGALAAQSQR